MRDVSEIDTSKWERGVVAFSVASGKAIGETLREMSRRFVQEVVKLTPPFKSFSVRESFAEQRRIGDRAVSRDIQRVYVPIEDLNVYKSGRNPKLQNAIRGALSAQNPALMAELLTKAGVEDTNEIRPEKVTFSVDPRHHQSQRISRGRITRAQSPPKNYVTRAALARYIKAVQSRVGALKAGWAAAAQKFGVSLPAWIRRHSNTGQVVDNSNISNDPAITIRNTVPYIGTQNSERRIVKTALSNQADKIARQLESKMKGLWK